MTERRTVVRGSVIVAAAIVVADQVSKAAAAALWTRSSTHSTTNTGFSLGLFTAPVPVMVVVTLLCVGVFGAHVVRLAMLGRLSAAAVGLLIGGALSNLADRVALGGVRDFIPAGVVVWNLADLSVLLGVGTYMVQRWAHARPPAHSSPRTEGGDTT